MQMTSGGDWICMDCAARNGAAGNCGECGEGPVLALADPQVRSALKEQDGEQERKRSRMLLGVASGIGAIVGFPLVFTLGMFIGLAAVVGLGGVIFLILRAVFPYRPRFADIAG
jgi:hypothetical protein